MSCPSSNQSSEAPRAGPCHPPPQQSSVASYSQGMPLSTQLCYPESSVWGSISGGKVPHLSRDEQEDSVLSALLNQATTTSGLWLNPAPSQP